LIAVSPGAPGRMNLIPSRSSRPKTESARVHPMAAGEKLGGPNATGKPGDWVIENNEVVFVVDGLGGGSGFAESGGNVIDAADAKTRKDELGQFFTYFGTFPRQGVNTQIDARVEPDGIAVIESRGQELYEPTIEVVTQMRLGPNDRALLLRTTLTNKGSAKLTGLGLGDAIQWGGTEKLAPGKAVGFKGPSTGPFIGGVGRFASYAITSTEGEIAAISGGAWTDTEQQKDVELEPGASTTYERIFLVGERPDVASLVSELTRASGGEAYPLEIALTDSAGAPVKVTAGAKIVLGTETTPDVMTIVATRDGDTFGGDVPPGKWVVSYAPSVGRRGDGKKVSVEVKKGGVSRVMLTVTEPGAVSLGPCVEAPKASAKGEASPIPCKLTIEGVGSTATPDFGPAHVASIAKNIVTLRPAETVTVPLPHGRYRVSASRGPEYDLASAEIAVPGAALPPFTLRRVVDTSGYVATDFHQHTILSADAPVATRDRVLANAAEGVEVAVSSEHNAVADLRPIVKELGLSPWLVQIVGDEVTSDASKKPFGHANVFPIEPRPEKPRNGAPIVRDRLAADVFAEARALPGAPHVLQINHPRSGKNGYFDQLDFDPKTGVGTKPGYDATFDAIEVWNGRVVAHRTRVLEDYFALLRTSHPTTPIADTDTHGIVGEEPGYPRTFVRLGASADAPLDGWDAARSRELVEGIRETRDVVLSNGPFVAVSANGVGIGGVARPRAGVVEVKVRVTTAPWVVVDKAELRLVRGAKPTVSSLPLVPKKNAAGALVAEATFSVKVDGDDAFVVIVSGTKPMRPVLSGDDAEIAPWAMTGPVWIDANGDDTALGRKR
ncbi:MAG TPA: CehA/McbA family metallohydrolase, partial [Labilithrix sp.]|nr:CehA/McbA family metallohydrolase [Labilithrix sp.]